MRDLSPVLPNAVLVYFSAAECDTSQRPRYASPVTVPLNQAGLPDLVNFAGSPFPKIFHDRAAAVVRPNQGVVNAAELNTLAQQIARDFYAWQLVNYDRVYNGALNVQPEGYTDEVVVVYGLGRDGAPDVATRLRGRPYQGGVEELAHGASVTCCAGGVGGPPRGGFLVPPARTDGQNLIVPTGQLYVEAGELKVCRGGETTTPACCPPCLVCISVTGYCQPFGAVAGAKVTITDALGTVVGTCTTGPNTAPPGYVSSEICGLPGIDVAFGCCCLDLPGPGTYTVTITADKYQDQTITVNFGCDANGGVNGLAVMLEPTDLTPVDPSDYVSNPCCPCAPHGDQPNRPPRTFNATLDGPQEILGGYAGNPIALSLAADSDDGTGYPDPTKFLHWTSGCLPLGGFGACYGTIICPLPGDPGGCDTPSLFTMPSVLQKKVPYGSCRVDLYQFYPNTPLNFTTCLPGVGPGLAGTAQDPGHCVTALFFTNFWNGDCQDLPLPACDPGQVLGAGPKVQGVCPCPTLFFPNAGPRATAGYSKSIVIYGLGAENYPPFAAPAGPVLGPVPSAICRPIQYRSATVATNPTPSIDCGDVVSALLSSP